MSEMQEYGIAETNNRVPRWLKFTYIILPIWGAVWFYLYWNGSVGALDRGYWQELERAANTTQPIQDLTWPEKDTPIPTEMEIKN